MKNNSSQIYGGVEVGGTKIICAAASGPDNILAEARFPTTTPTETIQEIINFFNNQDATLSAIGVASFGPIDLDPDSKTYGYITSTPKPSWANTDLLSPLKEAFDLPVGFDTDVNGAALGEYLWGSAQGLDTFIYLTIGTGIGGGGMIGGKLMHGLVHPEMGHILIPHDKERDPFPGVCPFHGDCFEGLATGPAMKTRWGKPAEELPKGHPGWELEAEYIALGLVNYITTLSPQRIILGGGVMHHPGLIELVRGKVQEALAGYVQHPSIINNIDSYIVLPGLGDRAGVLGAIGLGMGVVEKSLVG